MDEQNSGFILCDISFNGQLVADVKLPRACSMGNIVQGLWLDDNFRKTGLAYLNAKDEKEARKADGESSTSSKCFRGIDRCILRAYVAIRIMPAWKWLEFKDFIVDFENKKDCYTVGDVLGTLCTGLHKPVLRIVPKNENEADDQEVKNIVTELLKTKSLATLAAAECPLSYGMLSLIAQGKYTSTIGYDKCQAFIRWLRRQDLKNDSLPNPEQKIQTSKLIPPSHTPPSAGKSTKPRITFSQNEIDNLTRWFNMDERPSKEVMQDYTNILNIPREAASIRLLTPESIFFWFKNKRSKKKKQEVSLLEPWERVEENEISENAESSPVTSGSTPQVTMGLSTSQVSMAKEDKGENGEVPISIKNCEETTGGAGAQIGLATVLARYSSPEQSPTKQRKIPKSRASFDPHTELSCLNAWFEDNERPNKEVIEEYTNVLNAARSEKSKRMLSSDSVAMWFKNKRAKKRRSEGSSVYPPDEDEVQEMEESKAEILSDDGSSLIVTSGVTNASVATTDVTTNGISSTTVATGQNDGNQERNVYSAGLVSVKTNGTPAQQM